MSIYNLDGQNVSDIYGQTGTRLNSAYDISGGLVYPDSEPDWNFKVMSSNVQWFGKSNSNTGIMTEELVTQNADIIGMQEYQYRGDPLGTIGGISADTFIHNSGYDYIYTGTLDTNMKAIVSKYQMSDFTETRFSTTPTDYWRGDEYRSWTKSYFTFNNKQIAFFNTHFDTTTYYAKKVVQAQEIFEALQEEETFILTGDFNLRSDSVNSTEYTSIVKQFLDAGYNMCNGNEIYGFHNTWIDGTAPTGNEMYPLDVVITSADIDMVRVEVDEYKAEAATGLYIDHYPIIAYLNI